MRDKTKWSFSCSTDAGVMGNRKCDLGSIQALFTCVYEIVDRCIHCGIGSVNTVNTFWGLVYVCLYVLHTCTFVDQSSKDTTTSPVCTHKVQYV